LASHFLQRYAAKYALKCTELSQAALARLSAYAWPGNVRELRNVIERSAVLADGTSLKAEDLPDELAATRATTQAEERGAPPAVEAEGLLPVPFLADFREARRAFERAYIERCLVETGGNVTRAAERVGMHRQSLQQKLKDLGLTRRYVVSADEAEGPSEEDDS